MFINVKAGNVSKNNVSKNKISLSFMGFSFLWGSQALQVWNTHSY